MTGSIEVKVDVRDLQRLYVQLRAVDGNLQVELRRGVVSAAKPVVATAKQAAGFSSRIPGTVKTKVSFAARNPSVTIVAGGPAAPHAAAFEHRGKYGSFRHPVFGNREVWVSQPASPFLRPSLQSHARGVEQSIAGSVDTVMRKAGFR